MTARKQALLPFAQPTTAAEQDASQDYPNVRERPLIQGVVKIGDENVRVNGIFPAAAPISIAKAQRHVVSRMGRGTDCPCCGQRVQLYRRGLYRAPVSGLVSLCKATQAGDFTHTPDIFQGVVARGGDFTKLVHWGFIEPEPGDRDDGSKRTGRWRPTQAGVDFLRGKPAPRYAFIFDGNCVGFSKEKITVSEALGEPFNYAALMGSE